MLTQDGCLFYNSHSVYTSFGGVVFETAEAERLAAAVAGKNKGVILQNHGLLTVGATVDEACYLFGLMERLCEIQLKVEAAEVGSAGRKEGARLERVFIEDGAAEYTREMGGAPVCVAFNF
jgi:ribulose-5-phosphate 4-epimerase/fuculose-1-phosphate aldolase